MEHLFCYIAQAPNKEWMNASKSHNIPVTTYLFLKKI